MTTNKTPAKRGRPPKPKEVEEWRDIVGYEGLYQISNLGRVKALEREVKNSGALGQQKTITKHELIKKQSFNHQGYCQVSLMKDGKRKTCRVHRIVAEHFIVPTSAAAGEVNHIDGNKANNRVSNLEWVTPSENVQHAVSIGLKKKLSDEARQRIATAQRAAWGSEKYRQQRTAHLIERFSTKRVVGQTFPCSPVICVDTEEIFESVTAAAQRHGVSTSAISAAAKGKCKTCKNYRWRYV
jgi:hypothetical protein